MASMTEEVGALFGTLNSMMPKYRWVLLKLDLLGA